MKILINLYFVLYFKFPFIVLVLLGLISLPHDVTSVLSKVQYAKKIYDNNVIINLDDQAKMITKAQAKCMNESGKIKFFIKLFLKLQT